MHNKETSSCHTIQRVPVPNTLVKNNELAGKRKRILPIKRQKPIEAGPSFSSRPSCSSTRKIRKKNASNAQDFHFINSEPSSILQEHNKLCRNIRCNKIKTKSKNFYSFFLRNQEIQKKLQSKVELTSEPLKQN